MDTHLNDDRRDYAETIRSSGDACLRIINDITGLQQDRGWQDGRRIPAFDLRELLS